MILRHLAALRSKRILLGSGSPRRKELLQQMGLTFEVKVSGFAEDLDKSTFASPSEYVKETCNGKAEYLRNTLIEENELPDIIICADTVVVLHDDNQWQIMEKPRDQDHARTMIQSLCGRQHQVITAVSVIYHCNGKWNNISFTESTNVRFASLPPEEIEAYIQTDEPYDKAGGYGIQGMAGCFVESLEGCYYNVMGLPIHRLSCVLSQVVAQFEQK